MLIISASNVSTTKDRSQSLVVSEKLAKKLNGDVLDLRDYKLKPCKMCEKCLKDWKCDHDDFGRIRDIMNKHDGYIIVCPHYAMIPSKLLMLVEKLQEMTYLSYCTGRDNPAPMKDKYVCIIAHGGMTEGYEELYTRNIIDPLSYALGCMGMQVLNNKNEKPLCFGVKKYHDVKESYSMCFKKDDDVEKAEEIINRAVELVAAKRG